jgi:hypothetical protein
MVKSQGSIAGIQHQKSTFMKKNLFNLLTILGLMIAFTACSGDDTDNPNVIKDEQGIKIEISWSNNATDPTDGTSLELNVKDGFLSVFSTNNWHSFGSVEIQNGSLNNGTYALDVQVDAIDRLTNYKITVTGLASGKV